MKKITVFRLENKNGLGPFRGGHRDEANNLKGHFGIRLCLVDIGFLKSRIFKKFSKKGWLCGWSSEAVFNNWMNGKEEYFNKLGYFKVKYLVSIYKLCAEQQLSIIDAITDEYVYEDVVGYQVFFNPEKAIKSK